MAEFRRGVNVYYGVEFEGYWLDNPNKELEKALLFDGFVTFGGEYPRFYYLPREEQRKRRKE